MPNKIKPKRSYTAGAVPTTSDLDTHELAINWADNKAYTKNAAGQIVSVTLGGGSASTDSRWDLFLPAAPTGVTGTAGNAQATVSWTAPTVSAQTPVTDYTVQYSSNNGSSWTTFSRSASTATSATVTGLTNGTSYTFRVAAVNGVGTGSYSTASAAVTPSDGDSYWSSVQLLLPGDTSVNDASSYARSVTANGSAAASTAQKRWGAGSIAFNGSSDWLAISSGPSINTSDFTLEMWFYPTSSMSGLYGALADSRTGASGSALSNGFYFGYTTTANQIGWFDGATNSFVARATVTPSTWNHIAVTRYSNTVSVYVNGTLASQATVSTSYSNPLSLIGKGYDNAYAPGYIDDFRVTVGSNRGYTGASITVPTSAFPTVGPMSAPTSLAATGGNAQVSLTWTAPSYNGGSAITDYSVQYSTNSGSTWTTFADGTSTAATATVSGLTNGTAYVFRVAGINANGTGTYTAASSSVTPSAAIPFTSTLVSSGSWSGSGTSASKLTPSARFGSAKLVCGMIGTLRITGGFDSAGYLAHDLAIRKNTNTVLYSGGGGGSFDITVSVSAGDEITFAVDYDNGVPVYPGSGLQMFFTTTRAWIE